MKCDYCGKNEATSSFVVSYMGTTGEVHLCPSCLEQFQQYAAGMMGGFASAMGPGSSGWEGLSPARQNTRVLVREPEENRIPTDVGEELKARRRLAELKARLEDAIAREDYESAAGYRDELYRTEKERDAHAT